MNKRTTLLAVSSLTLLSSVYLAACGTTPVGTDGPGTGGSVSTGGTPIGGGGVPGVTGGTTSTGSTGGIVGNTGGIVGGVGGGSGGIPATGGAPNGTGGEAPVSGVTVQMDHVRQIIRGFGFNTALSPGGALPWDDLFTTDSGPNAIGLSILRVGMNPNGSLTGYGIDEAKSRGARIIGSTWTPQGSWKTSGTEENGGHVLPQYYEQWADIIAGFVSQYKPYAMSIANESDFKSCPGVAVCTVAYDTTEYYASEMVEWVKVAGPAIKAANASTLVIAPEASEWIHAWSNISGTGSLEASHPHSSDPYNCGCFGNEITPELEDTCSQACKDGQGYDAGHAMWNDPAAWAAFDILGVHEYDSQKAFAWPADVNGGVRDKEVWQTEMSGVMHWPEQGPSTDINNGVAVAGWIHSALTVGEASAWLYWWYEAYYDNDNEGLAITQNSNTIAKRYYALGQYSKFIRPDTYHAVNVANGDSADVLVSAYKGDGGELVVVAINKSDAAAEVPITITGGTAPAMLTPHVTSADASLEAGTAVPVTAGVFTASLPAKTITSFVAQ
jgi:O-glycosyl hydrolase